MKMIRITPLPIARPAGVTGGNWRIGVDTAGGSPAMPTYEGAANETPWPTTLPAGTYTLRGRRLDTAGNPLGGEVTGTYVWNGEASETVDVAGGIGVVDA